MRLICLLKSKIHNATVTEANIDYIGSITIDSELMQRVGLAPKEQVHVWNLDNGERFETYTLVGAPGSGTICLNGAAARRVGVGHRVIIAAFCWTDEAITPQEILVDQDNKFVKNI